MAGPQGRKGRDPELHFIHTSLAEANRYTGQAGELTFVANANGDIVQLRAHNGTKIGGYAMPLAPGSALMAEMVRVVLPPFIITVPALGSFTLNHQLGYIPDVQLLDGSGALVTLTDISIVHDDFENTTFHNANSVDETFTVILG